MILYLTLRYSVKDIRMISSDFMANEKKKKQETKKHW